MVGPSPSLCLHTSVTRACGQYPPQRMHAYCHNPTSLSQICNALSQCTCMLSEYRHTPFHHSLSFPVQHAFCCQLISLPCWFLRFLILSLAQGSLRGEPAFTQAHTHTGDSGFHGGTCMSPQRQKAAWHNGGRSIIPGFCLSLSQYPYPHYFMCMVTLLPPPHFFPF